MSRKENIQTIRETICNALCYDDEYDDCMRVLEKYKTWTLLSLFGILEIL